MKEPLRRTARRVYLRLEPFALFSVGDPESVAADFNCDFGIGNAVLLGLECWSVRISRIASSLTTSPTTPRLSYYSRCQSWGLSTRNEYVTPCNSRSEGSGGSGNGGTWAPVSDWCTFGNLLCKYTKDDTWGLLCLGNLFKGFLEERSGVGVLSIHCRICFFFFDQKKNGGSFPFLFMILNSGQVLVVWCRCTWLKVCWRRWLLTTRAEIWDARWAMEIYALKGRMSKGHVLIDVLNKRYSWLEMTCWYGTCTEWWKVAVLGGELGRIMFG